MRRIILSLILNFLCLAVCHAWNHSIELGYGRSHDSNDIKYINSGFLLSSDLLPLHRTCMSFWTLNGSIGQWHTTEPVNKNLTTGALALALRLYPFTIANYPTYLLGSLGPAYISKNKFGTNEQAAHVTLQTNLGLGAEFQPLDVNLRLVHYSNCNSSKPNDGFNVLYLFSIGYLF